MPDPESRLNKIEESHAFVERASEQLSEQIREIFKKIEILNRRLGAIESRLVKTEPSPTGDDDEA